MIVTNKIEVKNDEKISGLNMVSREQHAQGESFIL